MELFDIEQWRARRSLFAEGDGAAGAGGSGATAGAAAGGAAAAGAASGAAGAAGADGAKAGAAAAGAGAEGAKAGGAAAAADWRTGIADEKLREHASRYNSLDELVKGSAEMRSERDRLRSTAIIKPGEKATDEEKAAYRKAIGVPDKSDEYLKLFPQPEAGRELPAEVAATRKTWADRFHAANVPADVAAQLVKDFATDAQAQETATREADQNFAKETEAALKKEWGADYDTNKAYAAKAAQNLFGPDFATANSLTDKNDRLILDNPLLAKAFAKIGREMGEDRLGGAVNESARATIDQQITDVRDQQAKASASGDSRKANELYKQEQALIAKRDGNKTIVGAGRAA